jgi:hypothetical protein
MRKLTRNPEAPAVVPICVGELEGDVRRLLEELGPSAKKWFRTCLLDHFRNPPGRHWTWQMWLRLDAMLDSSLGTQTAKALSCAIDGSTYSRAILDDGGGSGFEPLLAAFMNQSRPPNCLPAQPLPTIEQFSLECYAAALSYARDVYEKNKSGQARSRKKERERITGEEFAHLLYLYREPQWFRYRRVERDPDVAPSTRSAIEGERSLIARRVRALAEARLVQVGRDSNIPSAQLDGDQDLRLFLERLEDAWGRAWLLTIPLIPYEWPV